MKEQLVEGIIGKILAGTTLTLKDLWVKNRTHFVSGLCKEVNRTLRKEGFEKNLRAYVLRRSWSHINIWDKADDKNDKEGETEHIEVMSKMGEIGETKDASQK